MNSQTKTPILFCAVLLGSISLSACSPSLKSTMQVPVIPKKQAAITTPAGSSVFVDEFRDGRSNAAIAEINGRQSVPATDIGVPVQQAVADALQTNGYLITDAAPVIISGEVKKWVAKVHGGLPSNVESEADIFIEVFDPANKRIYSGNYAGTISRQDTSLSEPEIQQTLGSAMSEAIGQMIMDKKLGALLSSY